MAGGVAMRYEARPPSPGERAGDISPGALPGRCAARPAASGCFPKRRGLLGSLLIGLKWAGEARPFQGFAWGKTLGALTRGSPLPRPPSPGESGGLITPQAPEQCAVRPAASG